MTRRTLSQLSTNNLSHMIEVAQREFEHVSQTSGAPLSDEQKEWLRMIVCGIVAGAPIDWSLEP